MVQNFSDWVVRYAQTETISVVAVFLVIAIALVSSSSFLSDRPVDVIARIAGAIAACLAAWAAWTQRLSLLSTTVTLLTYGALFAVVGIVVLRALRFARNREATKAITAKEVAKVEATPADEVDGELAAMVEHLRAENPEEFARIRSEVRRAA